MNYIPLPKPIPLTQQTWPDGTRPLVSIWCAAYQHERYIQQAVDSFLMQETTFPVQIILHDDASTDKSPEIIRQYAAKHPGVVLPILQQKNLLGSGVLRQLLPVFMEYSTGEFVAYCDGDDFWLTSNKLQQQAKVLIDNPDVKLCYHSNVEVGEDGRQLPSRPPRDKFEIFEQGEFIRGTFGDLTPASVLYRRSLLDPLPSWFLDLPFGDINLYGLASLRGRVAVISGAHSAYRRHTGGMYGMAALSASDQVFLSKELWWKGAICALYRHLADDAPDERLRRLCRRRVYKESLEVVWLARLVSDRRQMLHYVSEAAVNDWWAAFRSTYWWKHLCFALLPVLDVNRDRHLQVCRQSRKEFLATL